MPRKYQSDPRAEKRRVFFTCQNSVGVYLQASDMSTFTMYLSKNGTSNGAPAAGAPQEVNVANAKGLFYVDLAVADIDTAGDAALVITNTGGSQTMVRRDIEIEIVPALFGTAATGTLGVSAFTSSLTTLTDNVLKDSGIVFLTGALANQVKKIGASAASGGLITLATINSAQQAFTAAPSNGDVFRIINGFNG